MIFGSIGGAAAGVDLEVPGAGGVGLVASSLHGLDGPLGRSGHHVNGGSIGSWTIPVPSYCVLDIVIAVAFECIMMM